MRPVPISLACTISDRTRPILDGRVPIEGCEVKAITGQPEDLFARALRRQESDVTELSLNSFSWCWLETPARTSPCRCSPSRVFRHSAVYVRTNRGIDRPEDLAGKTVGVPEFQQTAALRPVPHGLQVRSTSLLPMLSAPGPASSHLATVAGSLCMWLRRSFKKPADGDSSKSRFT